MSFTGDLEHLPIVDVIQLLHSTRKTGTLCLKSQKGESQLVFDNGYIVSANHVRNNIRIGQILLEMNALTPEQLEQALERQAHAGIERKPLIAMLIEEKLINGQAAFTSLETLIELTIVEILTWNRGTFELNVATTVISDEFRYFPEILQQEVQLNTQSVLMDALRIYDEKMRDGTLQNGAFAPEQHLADKKGDNTVITDDILGLADFDTLERKVPDVFLGIKEYDVADFHYQKVRETIHGLPPVEQDRLVSHLSKFSETMNFSGEQAHSRSLSLAAIFFGKDAFTEHLISTTCKREGIFIFTTNDKANLDMIIDQSFAKELTPLLIIDAPLEKEGNFSSDEILGLLHQKREKYPNIEILQLVSPHDSRFPLRAMQTGIRHILSKPVASEAPDAYVDTAIGFLKAFHSFLQKTYASSDQLILRQFRDSILELETLREIPEVAFVALKFASRMFERTIMFVVGNRELIAEKGFGIRADKSAGATPPLLFTIPLDQSSVFQDVIHSGRFFYGPCNDTILSQHLHTIIGAPHTPKIFLMPIKAFGKVIALIYGDFGAMTGAPLQIDLLDIVVRHAGLVLDNNLYRKKLLESTRQN